MRRILLVLAAAGGLWWLLRAGTGTALLAAVGVGDEAAKSQDALSGPRPVVVLSPGSGWWSESAGAIDPGDQAGGLSEKDVALDVARILSL